MSFEKTGDAQPITVIKKCSKCGQPTTTMNDNLICPDCVAKQQPPMPEDEIDEPGKVL